MTSYTPGTFRCTIHQRSVPRQGAWGLASTIPPPLRVAREPNEAPLDCDGPVGGSNWRVSALRSAPPATRARLAPPVGGAASTSPLMNSEDVGEVASCSPR